MDRSMYDVEIYDPETKKTIVSYSMNQSQLEALEDQDCEIRVICIHSEGSKVWKSKIEGKKENE